MPPQAAQPTPRNAKGESPPGTWPISIAANRVVETIETADNPAAVAPVEGEGWALMFDAGTVWRIRPG
jgi:hypothetical protein